MYNGIGLQSVRGTGTSGHVQRNVAALRRSARIGNRGSARPKSLHAALREKVGKQLGAQPAFAAHESRRKVEVAVIELEEELVARGYESEAIEEMKNRLRDDLLARDEQEKEGEKDREIDHGRLRREEGTDKKFAADDEELLERRNERIKEVLGVDKDYKEGDFLRSMNTEKEKGFPDDSAVDKGRAGGAHGEKNAAAGSNVIRLRGKETPANGPSVSGEGVQEATVRAEQPAIDTTAGRFSGSESSVLTPSSPSSDSFESPSPSRRHEREEVSPLISSHQRGGDVLLEENLMHSASVARKEESAKRPASVNIDKYERFEGPQQTSKPGTYPDIEDERDPGIVREESAKGGASFKKNHDLEEPKVLHGHKDEQANGNRDFRRSNEHDYSRHGAREEHPHERSFREEGHQEKTFHSPNYRDGLKDSRTRMGTVSIGDPSLTDGSEYVNGRRMHDGRESQKHRRRRRMHVKSRRDARRLHGGRQTRYGDEADMYDSSSWSSRSLPRGLSRSPSPRKDYPHGSVSPPLRKRGRRGGADIRGRGPSKTKRHRETKEDDYKSDYRSDIPSSPSSRSASLDRKFRRSISPRRRERRRYHRRERNEHDSYESGDSSRSGRVRGEVRKFRLRERSLSPRARVSDRLTSRDRYRSQRRDRYRYHSRSMHHSPSRDGYRSPSSEGYRSPSRKRQRLPVRDVEQSPPGDRFRSPPRDRYRSPSRNRYRSPSRDRYRSPSRDRYRSPSRDRYRSPPRDRYRSPSRDRYRSPSIGRYRSPSRDRLRSPSKERYRPPTRNRYRSSSKNTRRSPSPYRYRSMAEGRHHRTAEETYRNLATEKCISPSQARGAHMRPRANSEGRRTWHENRNDPCPDY